MVTVCHLDDSLEKGGVKNSFGGTTAAAFLRLILLPSAGLVRERKKGSHGRELRVGSAGVAPSAGALGEVSALQLRLTWSPHGASSE